MVKVIKLYKNFNINGLHKNAIILIGNFDGLHLGHQKLFAQAKKFKKKYSYKIGVLNFEPMPKMYFNPKLKNFRISSHQQKIKQFIKLGVDFVITKKFNKDFSKTKSKTFIKNILGKKIQPKFIFVSNNFKFGKGNILYPNSNINYNSNLGNFNILQFNSSIGHNSKIEDNCFIGSNSTISSNCLLKKNIFIGANSNISRNIKIGSGVDIAPSALIYKDIKRNTKVTSLPRLILSKIKI